MGLRVIVAEKLDVVVDWILVGVCWLFDSRLKDISAI